MAFRMAVCLAVACLPVVADAQVPVQPGPPELPGRVCLHGPQETAAEAGRRREALAAMRMIFYVLDEVAPRTSYPRWEDFATLPRVMELRSASGAPGDLARKIEWGSPEPLPGWGIAYVATALDVRFALTDLRDPCGFAYSSRDPNVVGRRMRIVPLT